MNKKMEKFAHLFLYFGYAIGVVAIFLARYNPTRQFLIIVLLVAFYVIWGFVYHHAKKEATGRLFLEYLLIALIALLAGFFVLMN